MLSDYKIQEIEFYKREIEGIESQIANLEKLQELCRRQFSSSESLTRMEQLNNEIDNYTIQIEKLFDKIKRFEYKIDKLQFPSDQIIIDDESLCLIDFKKAMEIFNKIQGQFDDEGDVALFFIEEYIIKRGNLCLIRFKDLIQSEKYRAQINYWQFESNNFQILINKIAGKNGIIEQDLTMEHLIEKIGNSFHDNYTLFIEITCDIKDKDEIETFIHRLIHEFWQPLRKKIKQVTEEFEGIKVVAVIVSYFSEISSSNSLSNYFNNHDEYDFFARDKLVNIPLENWTQNDIYQWLITIDDSLGKRKRKKIAQEICEKTIDGAPNNICYFLQTELQTLMNSTC